ncbi:expressed unknown protein [Seminavis robusta]|uniref:Uncharacterized protein n=1 Tax=Seminavis robusta TaxID=568900 RepID=A0A9N8DRU1_9STRA|nr:expressed unknown protein [Seminavis robusta]|eukprot:Sro307_g113160.1 n/a (390) ;mRNA; f:7033-8292
MMPTKTVLVFFSCLWALSDGFLQVNQNPLGPNTSDSWKISSRSVTRHLGSNDENETSDNSLMTRRNLLHATAVLASSLAYPRVVQAAAPLTEEEANSVKAKAHRKLRPKPVQTLRPSLDKDFASLFMTSSYQSMDDIDCVPMDQFQRDFAIIRDAEYQQYSSDFGSPINVDMTDPNYFDFLSFAQYAAINREVSSDAPFVFTEQKPITNTISDVLLPGGQRLQYGPTTIVKRDAALTNDKLSSEHSHRVASAILDHLDATYGGTKNALPYLPLNTRPGSATLLASLNQLVTLFLMNGYAFSGSATIGKEGRAFGDASGTNFVLSLTAPATLWSGQALQLMGKTDKTIQFHNDFLLKTAKELMARCGYQFTAQTMNVEGGAQSVNTFTIG